MNVFDAEDRLEPLGIAVGVFLILGSLGTLLGAPWSSGGLLTVVVQLLGIALGVALGAGLVWLSYEGGAT